ncbi:MAG: hypothetical protein C0501_21430 [Isosphaera sp.]|nr:hypothetical protein [Isosphaera sp.]
MARTRRDDPDEDEDDDPDDWGADGYDPDDPETYPQGLYDDDGPPTVPCPHCRADVFEDSERCPRCGTYLTGEDAPPGARSGGWVVVMVLALLAAAMWAAGR